jgi:hypothetical protein
VVRAVRDVDEVALSIAHDLVRNVDVAAFRIVGLGRLHAAVIASVWRRSKRANAGRSFGWSRSARLFREHQL